MKDCGFPIRITPKAGQHIIEAEIPAAEPGQEIFYDIEDRKLKGIENFHKWIQPKSLTARIAEGDNHLRSQPPPLIWNVAIQYRITANEGLQTIQLSAPTSRRPFSGQKGKFQGWRIRIFPNYIWNQHKKHIMRETRVRNQIQRI